jgi:Flp pilus assembly pilin Flp
MNTDPNREMTTKEAWQAFGALVVVAILVGIVCILGLGEGVMSLWTSISSAP